MNPRDWHSLEFDQVLARLAAHAEFSASVALARALTPATDPAEVARRQGETTEARALLAHHPDLSSGGARDVRPMTKRARLGAVLMPLDLLELKQTLIAARTLRRTLLRLATDYPRLAARAAALTELPTLIEAIGHAIDERAHVVDTASDNLARLRHELNLQRGRLLEKLQRVISSPSNAQVIQEPIITERDGRYVIPIRAEAKGRIPGLVHDTSASGATLFIEPLALVEMGNRLRELERAEQHELERILRDLTALVATQADTIDRTVELLAELDLAFAKAKYAEAIQGVEPQFRPLDRQAATPTLELLDARHPLLDPATVVPISVRLDPGVRILVITGPNTGGKTVTLKTVGLMALMAQSGLHIPARAGSYLPIFSGVYADIGDEQSIAQSLSTFSAHLKNIIQILRQADSQSLVLLDELGAGTDPVEGAALARAILMHLLERQVSALVATHYAELKAFAHTTPGVQNASMEFDVETLAPTYHLTIGLPGQSNAFAIAQRLGLEPRIIEQAQRALTRTDIELEKMLAEIKRTQQESAAARAHAEMAQREAEQRAAEARRQLAQIEQERAEMLRRAHEAMQAEIRAAREELHRLQQAWRSASLSRDFVEGEHAKLDKLAERLPAPAPVPAPVATAPGKLQVGTRVWVARLGQLGQVTALDATEAEVQVGNFRMRLRLEEIQVAEPESSVAQEPSPVTLPVVESPGMEVSLRGMRADDALAKLEKYLDRAYLAGLPYVRVIHGKGTGTLRKLARDLLRQHPLVASIREAEPHEGGEGVTIVELAAH